MKISNLKELDSSFTLIQGDSNKFTLTGISHSDKPLAQTFIFIKSSRYFKDIGRKSDSQDFDDIGIVFDQEYYSKNEKVLQEDLKNKFGWIATVKQFDRAMCVFSKLFYDKKFSHLNYQVDGRQMQTTSIHPTARISQGVFIGEGAEIGENVQILPGCTIMPEVKIGAGSILYPNITLYPYTKIGENCRIHANTVIGADGFGYNFFDGSHNKIWHFSGVVIGDSVEIGASTVLDAGAFTPTEVGSGTKIDNLVQIAHNVKMGNHVVVCGMVGFGGSVEVDDYCAFGAKSGVAPAARLGKGVQLGAMSAIMENTRVDAGEIVAGFPARPVKEWMRGVAILKKLSKK